MATYLELRSKAEKLMAEAEQLRVKELEEVIAEIKEKIKAHGLTARDLGLTAGSKKKSAGALPVKPVRRYRGPNGEIWLGGRGRKPNWVSEALAKGQKLDDFAI